MSTYIKLSTLEYPRHNGDIQNDPAGMADYAEVQWVDQPTFNRERERCAIGSPAQVDGQWVTTWNVTPIPDEEEAAKVRSHRNTKLKESDWTQVADAPVDQAAWATYRQALRDISGQDGFPWTVTWPETP